MGKVIATAVVALLVLTGCGSSDSAAPTDVPPSPEPVPSVDGPSPVVEAAAEREQVEQEVLAAYLASWEAWDAATDPANPELPGLAETSTGPALKAAVDQIAAWRASGRVAHDPEDSISEHRAEVVSVDGQEATVRDCSIDDGLVVIAATGEVVNDAIETIDFEASMVIEAGRWKLSSLKVVESWEGVGGCAE